MSYRLHVDDTGRLQGNADITHNAPFPTPAGSWGSGRMMGVVMHTEVGYEHAVIDEFNNVVNEASATFSIGIDGHIHQYGPVGKGWYAWAQMAGNPMWYSIEHEDQGHPEHLLTDAQITASAQVVDCLARFAGFPLQVTNHTWRQGYGIHQMGGAAWGDHSCPQATWSVPLTQGRAAQRTDILSRARAIRAGTFGTGTAAVLRTVTADGLDTLSQIAAKHHNRPYRVALRTVRRFPGQKKLWPYLLGLKWNKPMPKGSVLVIQERA